MGSIRWSLWAGGRDSCSFFFFSSRRRHTRLVSDWSSDVCSSDLIADVRANPEDAAPVVFRAEQNVLLELAEPATSAVSTATPGWVKVRHRDGQTGFIRVAQVFGL